MKLQFDETEFQSLVKRAVREAIAEIGNIAERPIEPLLSEPEAAAIFGVESHVLRDARKRGEIGFHRIGKFVRYERSQLEAFRATTLRSHDEP